MSDSDLACLHLARTEGQCEVCGDCVHELILNGACFRCGSTALDGVALSPKRPALIPAQALLRAKRGGVN